MPRACRILRVFTRDGSGGNHLGVVTDVDGLSDVGMQRIAAELGYSETVFTEWPDGELDPSVRIFTPATELPFAGHPLVGTAWVYATEEGRDRGTLYCAAGTVGYRVDGDLVWVEATVPVTVDEVGPLPAEVVSFGFAAPIRTWTARLPFPYLVAGMADDDDVTTAVLDAKRLGDTEIYLFHRADDTVHARFFAPVFGVAEDPATGSAAVALAHSLTAAGEDSGDLVVHQGAEVGSPSEIRLRWRRGLVEIGGTVADDGMVTVDD